MITIATPATALLTARVDDQFKSINRPVTVHTSFKTFQKPPSLGRALAD